MNNPVNLVDSGHCHRVQSCASRSAWKNLLAAIVNIAAGKANRIPVNVPLNTVPGPGSAITQASSDRNITCQGADPANNSHSAWGRVYSYCIWRPGALWCTGCVIANKGIGPLPIIQPGDRGSVYSTGGKVRQQGVSCRVARQSRTLHKLPNIQIITLVAIEFSWLGETRKSLVRFQPAHPDCWSTSA